MSDKTYYFKIIVNYDGGKVFWPFCRPYKFTLLQGYIYKNYQTGQDELEYHKYPIVNDGDFQSACSERKAIKIAKGNAKRYIRKQLHSDKKYEKRRTVTVEFSFEAKDGKVK